MPGNKSITDFFRIAPPQPLHQPTTNSEPVSRSTTATQQRFSARSSTPDSQMGQAKSTIEEPPESQYHASSSLSPPPLTPSNGTTSSAAVAEPTPNPSASSNLSNGRVIKSSDDEGGDSDSSLEDLAILLAARRPASSFNRNTRPKTPPESSRYLKTNTNFHTSPLALHSKPRFDMNALISHARKDEAAEAGSRRANEVMAAKKEEKRDPAIGKGGAKKAKSAQSALLESVVNEKEEGGMAKVTRALMRTEATVAEKRFYFFDTHPKLSKPLSTPFPKGPGIEGWQMELKDPQMRQHSFTSGFVEDMIDLGKQLPDELFIWILDEASLESQETMRTSYLNLLRGCPEQLHRLVDSDIVRFLFQRLGATKIASNTASKIIPTQLLPNPYPNRNWGRVCSIIQFLGKTGESLQQESREYIICTLLRMAVDRVVIENVDVLMEVQRAFYYLSRDFPENEWESSCTNISKNIFETVQRSTFRYQIIDTVPSGTPRLHDLRRRLAMCFFLNDVTYSLKCPHETIDLGQILNRLESKDFDTRPQTDFAELAALILLLDVAVDDGRSTRLDLKNPEVEKNFNENVDELVARIKDIMTSIGNPGAAFISRIEAKEALELVSQRIADTVRTKKLLKETWFDRNGGKDADDLDSEKKGMSKFLAKMKQIKTEGADGPQKT